MGIMALFYGLLQAAAVYSLIRAHRLYRQYRYPFLESLLYFLALLNGFAFLKIIGRFFLYWLLAGAVDGPALFNKINAATTFIAYPFLVLATYFFYAVFRHWTGLPVTRRFKWIYFSLEAVILALVFLEMYHYIQTEAPTRFPLMMFVFIASSAVFEVWGVWQLWLHGRRADEPMLRLMKQAGIYYGVALVIFYIIKLGFWGPVVSRFVYPFMYCTLHLYPLWLLSKGLKRCFLSESLPLPDEVLMEEIFRTHAISEREQEVVRLVLAGKTNSQIEAELFISIKTVRNHLYSVYQKLGVKTRVELMRRFQNTLRRAF